MRQLYSWCVPAVLQLVPLELPPSTHLPTSEGWKAQLVLGLWLVVPTIGFEPTQIDPARFETLCLSHSITPPENRLDEHIYLLSASLGCFCRFCWASTLVYVLWFCLFQCAGISGWHVASNFHLRFTCDPCIPPARFSIKTSRLHWLVLVRGRLGSKSRSASAVS